jgi:ATP-dependent Clp protease ATP-binding subunit ClpA
MYDFPAFSERTLEPSTSIPITSIPADPKSEKMLKEEVDEEDVAEVVSKWTGIPVSKMLEGDVEKDKEGLDLHWGFPPLGPLLAAR